MQLDERLTRQYQKLLGTLLELQTMPLKQQPK
jgi:hypothetical protein